MRVALVYKRYDEAGGSERQVAMLARDLVAAGHDVHVFTAQVRVEPPAGVSVHRMRWRAPGRIAQLLAFSSWAAKAVARAGPFDVSHAFGRTAGQDVYRVGGGCHRTYLEHAHAMDAPVWWRPIARAAPFQVVKARLEERALRAPSTRAIITNSGMVRDDLASRYDLPRERFTVIPNGVDLERFQPWDEETRAAARQARGIAADAPVVLFLGTGYVRKGLDATLRAFASVRASRPLARLLVAGRDGAMERWRRRARQLEVADAVTFLGGVQDPEAHYPLADVSVLPTAYDPAANGTLESLACGIPTITSAMNGAAEILTDGEHGAVVAAPVRPEQVADALVTWLDRTATPADRRAAREACRARAQAHPAGGSCDRILAVYRAVTRSAPPGVSS